MSETLTLSWKYNEIDLISIINDNWDWFDINKLLENNGFEFNENFSIMFAYNKIFIYSKKIKDPKHTHSWKLVWKYEINNWKIIFVQDWFTTKNKGLIYGYSQLVKNSILDTGIVFSKYDIEEAEATTKKSIANNLELNLLISEIEKLEKQSNPLNNLDIKDNQEVEYVSQSEVSYISENDKKRYIETKWALICIILYFYNPETKEVVLSHLDGSINYKTTYLIKNYIVNWNWFFAWIFWWDNSSKWNFITLYKSLKENWVNVKYLEMWNWDNSKSIIVDRETWIPYNSTNMWKRPHENIGDLQSLAIQNRVYESKMNWNEWLQPILVKKDR